MATRHDRERRRRHGEATYRLIRYADDFVVMVHGTEAHASALRDEVATVLSTMGLRLSEEKTVVCHIDDGFDFLGLRIQRQHKRGSDKAFVYTWPSKKSLSSITAKVKAITKQGTNNPLSDLLRQLNGVLRGWTNYFRHGVSKDTFAYLHQYTWLRVVGWLRWKLRTEVTELRAALEAVRVELDKQQRESSRNSANSGKPPSSDTLTERAAQNVQRLSRQERRKQARARLKEMTAKPAKRKPGKQPGAPGSSLARVADPDFVEVHPPDCCGSCGLSLDGAPVTAVECRQVFHLPARRLEVTEHQAETRLCSCGQVTKASFPPDAKAPASYGPMVRAVALYLTTAQHIPVARAAQLLSQVCGAPVSTGFIAGLSAEAASGLTGFMKVLRAILVAEDVLNADETGARISGARYWFHVACTDLVTLLDCHEKRGVAAFEDIGVLPFVKGVLVSDGWQPYWSVGTFEHALCLSHLLRDLASVAECDRHKSWADDMADLMVEAKGAVEEALAKGYEGLTSYSLQQLRSRYTKILNQGFAAVPARHRSGSVDRDAFNLLNRLQSQRHEGTRYWSDPRVSPTNNQDDGISGWSSCSRRSAVASAPWPGRKPSASYAATSTPAKSMGWVTSTSSHGSSGATPGCRRRPPRLLDGKEIAAISQPPARHPRHVAKWRRCRESTSAARSCLARRRREPRRLDPRLGSEPVAGSLPKTSWRPSPSATWTRRSTTSPRPWTPASSS
jgi:transposase